MRASLLALLLAGGCLAATGQDAAPGTPILDKGRSVQTEGPQKQPKTEPQWVFFICMLSNFSLCTYDRRRTQRAQST